MILELIEQIRGNHNAQDKIDAIKKNKAKKQVKCPDNMTPHLVSKNPYRYVCKPKDKKKSKILKKAIKKAKALNPINFKKKIQKAQDTKKYRGEL